MGQSLASHKMAMAATKHQIWRRVTTGSPGATACGPTTRTM